MSEAADALLSDLHGREDFTSAAAELSLYLADSKKELFDRWCDEVRLALYGNHLPHRQPPASYGNTRQRLLEIDRCATHMATRKLA